MNRFSNLHFEIKHLMKAYTYTIEKLKIINLIFYGGFYMLLDSGYSVLNDSLFNNYIDGIIIVAAEDLIKDINQKACEMLNIHRREVINESFNRVLPDLLKEDYLSDNTIHINNYCLSVKVIPTPFGYTILFQNISSSKGSM